MTNDPFNKNFQPEAGRADEVAPGIRRLVAPNPSPMTFRGTNTYLLGEVEIAVIDPGPDDARHLDAIRRAVGDLRRISHILVTHSHLDHSPLARRLGQLADAPVLALGDSWTGRSELMTRLAATADLGGGEGVDAQFAPDMQLADGQVVDAREWQLTAIATPGHFSNHRCFADRESRGVFSGDHVMGWATTLVSPPDGDLTSFMESLEKMRRREDDRVYLPGHGDLLENPQRMVTHLLGHRMGRESQILEALRDGPATAAQLAHRIYTEIPSELLPAAARNVFAHLIDLLQKNKACLQEDLSPGARFNLSSDS